VYDLVVEETLLRSLDAPANRPTTFFLVLPTKPPRNSQARPKVRLNGKQRKALLAWIEHTR
jgi:hypothetical protein